MNKGSDKNIIITSLFWKMMERVGAQGIQFIIQIVLARLLVPEQFGTIAIVMVFISLANVFVQSGFNVALIQKKKVDNLDFSSVFYFSLVVALTLYVLLFLSAPFISIFYNDIQLVLVLRVLGLTLFFGAINSIQNAFVARNMLFKKLFKGSLLSTLVSGTVGIILAYNNYGVWALVFQQLISQILIMIFIYFSIEWRPTKEISLERLKQLFSYGWKLLLSQLINVIYINLRTLIIGRIFTPSILGSYNRGEQFPKIIVSNIDGSIQSVMLPALSSYQDNIKRVKEMTRRAIMTSSYLVFPLMIGMAIIAEPIVRILLTDKWLNAIPFIQIFSFSYALTPIHTANLQAINALGRSDVFLKMEIIKKAIGIVIIILSIPFGIYWIAIGTLFSNFLFSFINAYPNKKLLNYSYIEQIKDILPSAVVSALMIIPVYSVEFLNFNLPIQLISQILIGTFFYFIVSYIFKFESLVYLINTFRGFTKGQVELKKHEGAN